MAFEDSGNNGENLSAANLAAQVVDAQNQAATEAGNEKLKAHQEELSSTTNRPERFGVGENSRNAKSALDRQSKSTSCFMAVASAQAYNQAISFNVGGRDISMSLGDLRNVVSDLRNQYGDNVRGGAGNGKDRDRMQTYDGLLLLIDDVATGKASPEVIAEYIQKHDLDKEIAGTALSKPDIKITDTKPQDTEVEQAGTFADQSAADLNTGLADDLYPIR